MNQVLYQRYIHLSRKMANNQEMMEYLTLVSMKAQLDNASGVSDRDAWDTMIYSLSNYDETKITTGGL